MKWHKMSVNRIQEVFLDGYQFSPEDLEQLRQDVRSGVQNIVHKWERLAREKERVAKLYDIERNLLQKNIELVAGIDEAGRGPLAGPVVAAAVILPTNCFIRGLNDSKKLTEFRRYAIEKEIKEKAVAWGIGAAGVHDIDRINIFQATRLAMERALKKLAVQPEHLLIDAMTLPGIRIPQTAVIHGDAKSASIAAASILAKCHRDNLMKIYDRRFPGYGFARHKGYPTSEHIKKIEELGETSIHRKSFRVDGSLGLNSHREHR